MEYNELVKFEEDYVKENFPEGWGINRSGGMLWSIGGNIRMSDGKNVCIVFTGEKMAFATFNDNRTMYLTQEEIRGMEDDIHDNDELLIEENSEDSNKLIIHWDTLLSEGDMLNLIQYFCTFLIMLDSRK